VTSHFSEAPHKASIQSAVRESRRREGILMGDEQTLITNALSSCLRDIEGGRLKNSYVRWIH